MSTYTRGRIDPIEFYKCDSCGKEASYLSDSWSEIEIVTSEHEHPIKVLHHCLECRSDKREWPRGDVR